MLDNIYDILTVLRIMPDDQTRFSAIVGHANESGLTILQVMAHERPVNLPRVLNMLSDKSLRYQAMTFNNLARTPLDILDQDNFTQLPAILKTFSGRDRLRFIRKEDSTAKKLANEMTYPDYTYINHIITCDIYLEHLQSSLPSLFDPDETYTKLTKKKINVVEHARTILENEPESKETMQAFRNTLKKNKNTLETRRDTWLTFFLKCIGLLFSGGLAYHSLFENTDGKELLDQIEMDNLFTVSA